MGALGRPLWCPMGAPLGAPFGLLGGPLGAPGRFVRVLGGPLGAPLVPPEAPLVPFGVSQGIRGPPWGPPNSLRALTLKQFGGPWLFCVFAFVCFVCI